MSARIGAAIPVGYDNRRKINAMERSALNRAHPDVSTGPETTIWADDIGNVYAGNPCPGGTSVDTLAKFDARERRYGEGR